MEQKVILKIIFGESASRYACDYGEKKAIAKLKKGTLEGDYRIYIMDTQRDADLLLQALGDFDGWNGWWLCEENETEKNV